MSSEYSIDVITALNSLDEKFGNNSSRITFRKYLRGLEVNINVYAKGELFGAGFIFNHIELESSKLGLLFKDKLGRAIFSIEQGIKNLG